MAERSRLPSRRISVRLDVALKIAIVGAALVWAFWPVAFPPTRAERSQRCHDAQVRYEARRTTYAADEVYYYCVRAR